MKIKRICQWCNKEFEVYASSLQSSNSSGKFCCRKCYNEYQRTLTGKKNNHSTRIAIKCANCGKEIWTTPYRLAAYQNKFCSNACKHEYHHNYISGDKNCNWKGGFSRYRGEDFEQIKRKHFHDPVCAICGKKDGIHIHHIIPYRLTRDNGIDNLVPLCRKHHKIIESYFTANLEQLGDYSTTKFVLGNIFNAFLIAHGGVENGTTEL